MIAYLAKFEEAAEGGYVVEFIRRSLLRFNTAPLGAVNSGGAGDLFPRIRKALKNESSIPRCSAAGILY